MIDHSTSQQAQDCSRKCDTLFYECLQRGEDESVCRMKRVPCDCTCSLN